MTVYFEAKTNNGDVQIRDDTYITWLYSKSKLGQYYKSTNDVKYHFYDSSYSNYYGIVTNFNNLWNPVAPPVTSYQMHCYELPVDAMCFIRNPYTDVSAHLFFALTNVTKQTGPYYYDFRPIGNKKYVGITNCTKSQADNFDLFVFSQGENPYTNDYGLECFDASGKKVFDSNRPPIRLLQNYNVQHVNYGNSRDLEYYYFIQNYQTIDQTLSFANKSVAVWVSLCGLVNNLVNQKQYAFGGTYYMASANLQTVTILENDSVRFKTRDFDAYLPNNVYDDTYIPFWLLEGNLRSNKTNATIINVTNL